MSDISPQLRTLAEKALAEWAFEGVRLHPLGISENASFRVDTPDKRYVLRVHRPGYHTLAELESEHVWTHALLKAGVDVPVPARTRDGREYVTLPFEDSESHIGMLEWVDGELLGNVISRKPTDFARHFRAAGRIVAAIHNQSSRWTVPDGFQRHRVDVEGLMGENPFWGPFWNLPQMRKTQREVIERARRTIAEELWRLGQSNETFSLIHADLHPHNLVVGDHGLHVIDFDDAGFGWHHYELAVALYRYQEDGRFSDIRAAMVDGYREVRSLADSMVDLLPMFFLVRSLAHLGWRAQRPEHGTDLPEDIEEATREARNWMG